VTILTWKTGNVSNKNIYISR